MMIARARRRTLNTITGGTAMFNCRVRRGTCIAYLVAASSVIWGAAQGQARDTAQKPDHASSVAQGVAAGTRAPARLPTMCAGYSVSVYAQVPEPMKLSFAPSGALYVGRQEGRTIHRVAPFGRSVSEFGPPMVDPDAVLFDASGRISGVPNAVLVGGGGILAAIFQDQTARVVFNAGFDDVDDMKFDHAGRLVFSDDRQQVLVSSGNTPSVLFPLPDRPGSIAIDEDDRIYVALADGTIRIYTPDGALADAAFARGLAGLDTYLAFGPGAGGFGKALYVLSGDELFRFDRNGKPHKIGAGFNVGPSSGTGFVFGPDKSLYVSDHSQNRILKISRGNAKHHQPPCPLR